MTYSESVEDYLKTIWSLQGKVGAVGTVELARSLGVAPASATGMIKRLATQRLIRHEPYRGVRLTAVGRRHALAIVRRHRVIETFLEHVLNVPIDDVHAEAERWEHVVSEDALQRMDELLGHPAYDPHGTPIPDADGALPPAAAEKERP